MDAVEEHDAVEGDSEDGAEGDGDAEEDERDTTRGEEGLVPRR